jgi:ferric-dicitrate binding protein FerR (iron transport regulator)
MGDRLERARVLASRIEAGWSDEQMERALPRVRHGIRRRRVARAAAWAVCGVLVALAATWTVGHTRAPASLVEHRAPLRLDDGTTAIPLTRDATIVTAEVTREAATVRLPAGAARFKVVMGRRFRVDAGAVQIDVIGTEFDVVHAGAERVSVVVGSGRVRVGWRGGEAILAAGQRGTFPPE